MNENRVQKEADMARKKKNNRKVGKVVKNGVPYLLVPKNATLRQIYAIYKKEFTAADLAKYAEVGPTVRADQLLTELEAIHASAARKRGKK